MIYLLRGIVFTILVRVLDIHKAWTSRTKRLADAQSVCGLFLSVGFLK